MKLTLPQMILIMASVCFILLALNLMKCAPEPEPELPIEIDPAMNPVTIELERAYRIIDSLVSFNNMLIRELEDCEDERTIEAD